MAFMSKVANLLLCTPFDSKSVVDNEIFSRLSVDVFLEECFSHPQFQREIEWKKEEENTDSSEYKTRLEELQYNIYRQKREYENFNTWLSNFYNFKVYVLSGHAGTGKTTFINYLKYTMSEKMVWTILDFTHAHNAITWFGDEKIVISSEKFASAYKKAYSSILFELRNIMFCHFDENENYSIQKICDELYHLDDTFQNRFALQYPAGNAFFSGLHTTLYRAGLNNKSDIVIQAAKYCKGYFGKLETKSNSDEVIQNALDILLLLLRCSHDEGKKFIITFDNIERFISKEEIYNQDVVNFRKNIISYCESINEKGKIHRGIFKFLVVVRNSTECMSDPKLQSLDELAARIDISDWFDIEDIMLRKILWLNSINMKDDNIQLVEQIVGDLRVCSDKSVTGLKLFIDPLLNNNTRLIVDFIGVIVESLGNSESIKKYREFWDDQTQLSKFAARSIVRGLILCQLRDSDNLFMHLKTYTKNPNDAGLGVSRKILTILYNHMQNSVNDYMSLDKVMREFFCVRDINTLWKQEGMSKDRNTIAEILFFMNSYSRRDNDWIQFIDLQYEDSEKSVVIENKDMLYEMITNNLKSFSVKIMPGGITYLKYIVASYEYFSMRYNSEKGYCPLFNMIPTVEEMKNCLSLRDLPCVKNILFVRNKAQQCIRILGDEDPSFMLYSEAGKGRNHKDRIINQHTQYLNLFTAYIIEKYCGNNGISEEIKRKYAKLADYISDIRKRYN